MILGTTIQNRLTKEVGRTITYEFDIRYLDRWVRLYPCCFPKFVIQNNYTCFFNAEKFRWELKSNI